MKLDLETLCKIPAPALIPLSCNYVLGYRECRYPFTDQDLLKVRKSRQGTNHFKIQKTLDKKVLFSTVIIAETLPVHKLCLHKCSVRPRMLNESTYDASPTISLPHRLRNYFECISLY